MSLLEITNLPTAENSAIRLHSADNVAIARVPLSAGQAVRIDGREVTLRDTVAAGHKVALRDIAAGERILRYGHGMGRASCAIAAGEHVHTHNVAFEDHGLDYEFPAQDTPVAAPRGTFPRFSAIAARMAAWGLAITSPWSPPAIAPPTPPN